MNPVESSIARESATTTGNAAERKCELRKTLIALRNGISLEHRNAANGVFSQQLIEWQKHHACAVLAVFWPILNEPDLHLAYAHLAQNGVQLALPVVTGHDAPLSFVAWSPGQAMQVGAFGVVIPAEPQHILTPQAILLPCLGFNAARVRLGYGGGYYDRTLALLPTAITAGIGYECCRVEFAAEPHDVALGSLITEQGIASSALAR